MKRPIIIKILESFLWILTLICLYIILCVGLGWFWTIGYSDNSENINQVLINLSYSYIAGLIFYFLISFLPYRLKIEKLKPAITFKIDSLYKQIKACAQSFDTKENTDIIEKTTLDELKIVLDKNGMYDNSFQAREVGYIMNNFQFLNSTRNNAFDIIDSLLGYKEFMKMEQVVEIEKIRDSDFFRLVKTYEDTPIAKHYYSSSEFKEALAEDLFEIIISIRFLKNEYNK
jgi:hypothetical protein